MRLILSHVRGIARALAFIVWTLAVGGAWVCVRPLLRGARRGQGGARTLALWSRGLCRLLGIRIQATGSPAYPGPRLTVSNHIGYLDVIVLSSLSSSRSPALFVSKDDLARWPVMGPLGKSVGTLFLDRERPRAVAEVSQGMRRAFGEGLSMIVFPEGTTTPGETVAAFHTALFEPALRADVPVQGVLLSYAPRHGRDPSDLAAWTGDASFVPHLYRLFRSGGLKVEARFKFAERSGGDRRAVAARVREWMLEEISGTAARSFLPRSAVQNAR